MLNIVVYFKFHRNPFRAFGATGVKITFSIYLGYFGFYNRLLHW